MVAWLTPLAPLLLGLGCGTETGNPEGTFELQYNARSSDSDVALRRQNVVEVDAVWLRLSQDVNLFADCDEGASPSVIFRGLGLTDHSGPEAVVQERDTVLEPMCRLDVAALPAAARGTEPDATDGASIAITGTLFDGREFTVAVPDPVTFELDIDDEPPPDSLTDGAWLLTFDVGTWLDADELEQATGDPIEISLSRNAGVLSSITKRLAAGVQLHHDVNANGLIDAGEPRVDMPPGEEE